MATAALTAPPSRDCRYAPPPPPSRADLAAASAALHPANRLASSPLELCTPVSDLVRDSRSPPASSGPSTAFGPSGYTCVQVLLVVKALSIQPHPNWELTGLHLRKRAQSCVRAGAIGGNSAIDPGVPEPGARRGGAEGSRIAIVHALRPAISSPGDEVVS
jgi:hypothetical protein